MNIYDDFVVLDVIQFKYFIIIFFGKIFFVKVFCYFGFYCCLVNEGYDSVVFIMFCNFFWCYVFVLVECGIFKF